MNEFYKQIKNNENEINSEDAYREIIQKLMIKNIRQNEKVSNLGEYDSETLFGGKLYRGNIYVFEYAAKNPVKYSFAGKDVLYVDTMPLFLMLGETQSSIYGINLNFCNKALRTIILNLLRNIDEDFYINGRDQQLARNKNLVISQKVYKFLSSEDAPKIIESFLKKLYPQVDFSFIFRNYSVKGI